MDNIIGGDEIVSDKENNVDLLNLIGEEITNSNKKINGFDELEEYDVIKALSKLAKMNTSIKDDDIKIAKEIIGNII